jgi:uncharacterized protein (TIGR02452 family)
MLNKYSASIKKSVRRATVFEGFDTIDYFQSSEHYETKVEIMRVGAEKVVKLHNGADTCVLNFAEFDKPGGNYLLGANTTEARLCRESTLYEVLTHFKDYYKMNTNYKNDGLYYNTGIFIPEVKFNDTMCNVLTAFCPDYNEWQNSQRNTYMPSYLVMDMNREIVEERLDFILGVLRFMGQKTIIIGSWCGIQNPVLIASHFRKLLETKYRGVFESVIFAIPEARINEAFKYIFGKHGAFHGPEYLLYNITWNTPNGEFHTKVAAYDDESAVTSSLLLVKNEGYKYEDVSVEKIEQFDHRAYLTPEQIIERM